MDTLSHTIYQVAFHPLFVLLMLTSLVGLVGCVIGVWIRLGRGQANVAPPVQPDPTDNERNRPHAPHPGAAGR